MSGSCVGGVGEGLAPGQSEAEAECKSFQNSNWADFLIGINSFSHLKYADDLLYLELQNQI